MTDVGNLLEKITNPMTIIIRVVVLITGYFFIFVRTFRTSQFFQSVHLGSLVASREGSKGASN